MVQLLLRRGHVGAGPVEGAFADVEELRRYGRGRDGRGENIGEEALQLLDVARDVCSSVVWNIQPYL